MTSRAPQVYQHISLRVNSTLNSFCAPQVYHLSSNQSGTQIRNFTSWWEKYVKGQNPDSPIGRIVAEQFAKDEIDVVKMVKRDVDDFRKFFMQCENPLKKDDASFADLNKVWEDVKTQHQARYEQIKFNEDYRLDLAKIDIVSEVVAEKA